jgi:hypothetical protein
VDDRDGRYEVDVLGTIPVSIAHRWVALRPDWGDHALLYLW